jgi:hypothetical protein
MVDFVRTYVDARKRCEAAFNTLRKMHETITSVSDTIKREPETFGFSGTAHGVPTGVNELVTSTDWPTVADLQGTLVQCHRAFAEMQNAWSSVPHEDRSSLQQPGNPWRPAPETMRRIS